ncbi:hypothetical protein AVEN_120573-1 [Araneus ventricosus]|uniref:Tc3 transposase DNA binding domain-containing protein n=1 Tax=Araneus ventricosus TaxID=182803 RepID=A0A4Y2HA22_ARAVE|nr:hypothetical protein AVEN_120573-1 [Araneus ventricosus]
MAGYQDLSDFQRGVIVGAREMGHSITEVAMKFGFATGQCDTPRVESCYQVAPETPSDFRHFQWPPKSPDMNIIEDIWDALLHAVEKKSPPPRTPMDLLIALQDSWCEFPPGYLQTLVESMLRHFASLLRVRGGPTRNQEGVPVFLALQCI